MWNSQLVHLILLLVLHSVLSDDYNDYWCWIQGKYCNGAEHIGCQPNSYPKNGDATNLRIRPLSKDLHDYIVHTHNMFRNQVANGSLDGYDSAAKMNVVKWDDDLAETAGLLVENGSFQHDQCRATETSPSAGQNIGITKSSTRRRNMTAIFESRLNNWFNEYKLNPQVVKNYFPGSGAGHFTAMLRDETTLVGCAAASYSYYNGDTKMYAILAACNYQFTNIEEMATYEAGVPCSGCPSKCSATYEALCEP